MNKKKKMSRQKGQRTVSEKNKQCIVSEAKSRRGTSKRHKLWGMKN